MYRASIVVLFLNSAAFANTLEFRLVDESGSGFIAELSFEGAISVPIRLEVRLDQGLEPTTGGIAEWSAALRINDLIDPPRVDICDTNAFFLGSALLDGMYDGTFEVISCDSASGILQISGGPYHEGEIVLGVGNLDWTAIAEGYCVLPRIDPCGTSMDVEIESITASTIDAGQSGPPYATSPFDSGALSLLPLIWEVQGLPCFHGDVNCDGAVNAGDIGIVASGSNFGQASPACDRADVDGSGGPINAGDIGEIANAAIFGSNIGIYCCCQTPTPDACGIPWAPSVASLTAMPGARLTSAANDAK